jgi:hypothetical protein
VNKAQQVQDALSLHWAYGFAGEHSASGWAQADTLCGLTVVNQVGVTWAPYGEDVRCQACLNEARERGLW